MKLLSSPTFYKSNQSSRVGFCILLFGVLFIGLLLRANPVAAKPQNITVEDISSVVNVRSPQLSPDGKHIAVIVSRPDFEDNKLKNSLVLINVETGLQQKLTHERHNVNTPRWSPDGRSLAFLAGDKNDVPQIFILPLVGGEAKQITKSPTPIVSISWRPTGGDIAYVRADEADKKKGIERHNKSFEVGKNDYLATAKLLPSHLWLVSTASGKTKRLTSGGDSVSLFTSLELLGGGISWSPDGQLIAFSAQPGPYTTDFSTGFIKILNLKGDTSHVLKRHSQLFSARPEFSPDGQQLIFNRNIGPESIYTTSSIFVTPTKGGEETRLGAKIDRAMTSVWMADGKSVLARGFDKTSINIWHIFLDGRFNKLDLDGVEAISDLSTDNSGAFTFVGVDTQRPDEVYYASSVAAKLQRLTGFNDNIASLRFGKVDSISWKSHDGFDLNGVLIYPPDFNPKKKYPLVLSIHGGPMWNSTEGFFDFGGLERLLAAQGWLVFSPNYRGSDNMGQDFQRALVNDLGVGPGKDVMSGIEAIKAMGIVDEKRIAVSGWSYGGYMTTWLTGNYQGWAAAVAGAAVTNLFDQYALSDIQMLFDYGLDGPPWKNGNMEKWRKNSPMSYAHKSTTPTLILANTGDARVSITQSYTFYHALKNNNVPVEFIAYPIPGHFPMDPVHTQDVYTRWVNWIEERFDEVK